MTVFIEQQQTIAEANIKESTIIDLRNQIVAAEHKYISLEKEYTDLKNIYEILESQSINSALEMELEKQDYLIRDLTETVIKLTSLLPDKA